MAKLIDRTGKGSSLSTANYDSNVSSLHGVNASVTGSTYTVDIDNQGDYIEFSNATTTTVTLDDISTISSALQTDDFKVTLVCVDGYLTINRSGTDVIGVDADTSIKIYEGESITLQTDSTGGIWNIVHSVEKTLSGNCAATDGTSTGNVAWSYAWTGGECTVTHNLGSANYILAAQAMQVSGTYEFVVVTQKAANSFTIQSCIDYNTTAAATPFDFILVRY